eukprot:416727-Hanusia_phi.AAC.1
MSMIVPGGTARTDGLTSLTAPGPGRTFAGIRPGPPGHGEAAQSGMTQPFPRDSGIHGEASERRGSFGLPGATECVARRTRTQ